MNIFKFVSRSIIENIVTEAIKEDKAFSDITTQMCVPEDMEAKAIIISKDNGILSGIQITEIVLQSFGTYVVKYNTEDSNQIIPKQKLCVIKGKLRGILSSERIILNFMQRMSGIATYTKRFVSLASAKGIKILDTRKTTPALRYIEKYAVLCGGGTNHRMDLMQEIMIKDNHLKVLNHDLSIVNIMRNKYPDKYITIEADSIKKVKMILNYDADRIMLDNMSPENIKRAIKLINRKCEIEVSGNIDENSIENYLIQGVDYISIGKLTHSFKSLDISLEITDVQID